MDCNEQEDSNSKRCVIRDCKLVDLPGPDNVPDGYNKINPTTCGENYYQGSFTDDSGNPCRANCRGNYFVDTSTEPNADHILCDADTQQIIIRPVCELKYCSMEMVLTHFGLAVDDEYKLGDDCQNKILAKERLKQDEKCTIQKENSCPMGQIMQAFVGSTIEEFDLECKKDPTSKELVITNPVSSITCIDITSSPTITDTETPTVSPTQFPTNVQPTAYPTFPVPVPTPPPTEEEIDLCSNLVKDDVENDETDIDCGGPTCPPCSEGRDCVNPSDCFTGICTNNACATSPQCENGVLDGNETAVDCGGGADPITNVKCFPCGLGQACIDDTDCLNSYCINTECAKITSSPTLPVTGSPTDPPSHSPTSFPTNSPTRLPTAFPTTLAPVSTVAAAEESDGNTGLIIGGAAGGVVVLGFVIWGFFPNILTRKSSLPLTKTRMRFPNDGL